MLEPSRAQGREQSHGASHEAKQRFRLVIADDHAEVREEIRRLLEPEFEVLRAVGEGVSLLEAVSDLKPDAVVSDIQMPRMDGIEAGRQLLDRGLCEAVVVLSMHSDQYLLRKAIRTGIRAYVLKLDAGDELIPAVYAALRGERYLSRGLRDTYREESPIV